MNKFIEIILILGITVTTGNGADRYGEGIDSKVRYSTPTPTLTITPTPTLTMTPTPTPYIGSTIYGDDMYFYWPLGSELELLKSLKNKFLINEDAERVLTNVKRPKGVVSFRILHACEVNFNGMYNTVRAVTARALEKGYQKLSLQEAGQFMDLNMTNDYHMEDRLIGRFILVTANPIVIRQEGEQPQKGYFCITRGKGSGGTKSIPYNNRAWIGFVPAKHEVPRNEYVYVFKIPNCFGRPIK